MGGRTDIDGTSHNRQLLNLLALSSSDTPNGLIINGFTSESLDVLTGALKDHSRAAERFRANLIGRLYALEVPSTFDANSDVARTYTLGVAAGSLALDLEVQHTSLENPVPDHLPADFE